jgi:hypothetical protein
MTTKSLNSSANLVVAYLCQEKRNTLLEFKLTILLLSQRKPLNRREIITGGANVLPLLYLKDRTNQLRNLAEYIFT